MKKKILERSVLFVLNIVSALEYTYKAQGRLVILLFSVPFCNPALWLQRKKKILKISRTKGRGIYLEARKNVVYGKILYADQPVLLWWQNVRNIITKVSSYLDFLQLNLHRSPAETLTLVRCTKSCVQINNKFLHRRVVTGYISGKC